MIGERVDEKEFFDTLEAEGLKATDSTYQQNLMKIFSDVFLQINDIIIYAKRAYRIDIIKRLFLGSIRSPIIGLGDYGYNYLGIPAFNLDFTFDIKNDDWYVDEFQYMMVQSGLDYIQNPDKFVNLTPISRPPVFAKRASGQFIITTVLSSLLALGWPLYYMFIAYSTDVYNLKLDSENKTLTAITAKYKKILKLKRDTIKSYKKELKELKNIYESKEKTLIYIHNKKVDYNLKSKFLYQIAKDLLSNGVKIEELKSNSDEFTLYLVSNDDKKITKYIKDISSKYSKSIKSIDIKRISQTPEDQGRK